MTRDAHNPLNECNRNYNLEEWERWDEDLVRDFSRWLTLVAKAFAIVILLGVLTCMGTWLWNWL